MAAGERLDQFYTRRDVARACVSLAREALRAARVARPWFVEPAAGDGAFFELLPEKRRCGMDLAPRHGGIRRGDFLAWQPLEGEARERRERVVIGNPPFGRRGNAALKFLLHGSRFADTIAFILPMCFAKHSLQKRVPADLRLAASVPLAADSFLLPSGKPFCVNAVFQIWTRLDAAKGDLRAPPPQRAHADFLLWQYNNTPAARRYFREDFDIGIVCQGFKDLGRIAERERIGADDMNKQWMLVKFRAARAAGVFRRLDYAGMSAATRVPGFRKHDLVRAYMEAVGEW